MDFSLTDKQKKLVATFREYGMEHFSNPQVVQWCRDQGLPDEVAKGFVDLYFNLPFSLFCDQPAHRSSKQPLEKRYAS